MYKTAANHAVESAKKSWGAGWSRIGRQAQMESVTFYIMTNIMGSGAQTISVDAIREISKHAMAHIDTP